MVAQTVGGGVVVEVTDVDDEYFASEHHGSELGSHDEIVGSKHRRMHDETKHLRVDTISSAPEYHTFDSDEHVWKVATTM